MPKMRGNGQGSVYKEGNKWRAVVTLYYTATGQRKTRSKICRTKKEALTALVSLNANGTQNEYAAMTFADVWDVVLPALDLSPGKLQEYKRAWKRLGPLHLVKIADQRTADLQRAIDAVPGGYHTKKAAKNVLGHIYHYALVNDIVAKNYLSFVVLPAAAKPLEDAFTDEELAVVWDYVRTDEEARWIIIMAYCGLRPGELRQIKKSDIHLKEQYMIGGIKTEEGRNRTIPLADRLLPVIQRQIACSASFQLLVSCGSKLFYERYHAFLSRIGIRYLPPRFCRHTFATRSAEAEIAPAIIQSIMGHKKYQTTLGYTHIRTDKKVESVNKL